MRLFRAGWFILLVLFFAVGMPGAVQSSPQLERLILAGPPGPLSIPLAYLVVNDRLSEIADEVDLVLWENQNQLRAIIAGEQADLVTMPVNNAAIFFNNDLDVQLLNIAAWDAAFGITADETITTLSDATGRRVVIPFEGSIPDLIFQYIATANELDPTTDFEVQYTPNPQQAAQMIISGRADIAILPEPLATSVLMNTRDSDVPLLRVFSLSEEWAAVTGDVRTPLTGTVALPGVQDQPEVVEVFQREYALAVEWVIENPEKAGELAEEHLPELGLTAAPVALSLEQTVWESVTAQDARADIEDFFALLLALSPDVIGGQLPDNDFYYDSE